MLILLKRKHFLWLLAVKNWRVRSPLFMKRSVRFSHHFIYMILVTTELMFILELGHAYSTLILLSFAFTTHPSYFDFPCVVFYSLISCLRCTGYLSSSLLYLCMRWELMMNWVMLYWLHLLKNFNFKSASKTLISILHSNKNFHYVIFMWWFCIWNFSYIHLDTF